MKKSKFIKSLLVLTALLLSIGQMWGDTQVTFTANATSGQRGYVNSNEVDTLIRGQVTLKLDSLGSATANKQIYNSSATKEASWVLSTSATSNANKNYIELKASSGYNITGMQIRLASSGSTASRCIAVCFASAFSMENNSVLDTISIPLLSNANDNSASHTITLSGIPSGTGCIRIYKAVRYDGTNKKLVNSKGTTIWAPSSAQTAVIPWIKVTYEAAAADCTDAYSFTYKNTSTEWTDPICFTNTETSDGNGGYFWIAECTIPTDGVSYKLGWEGADDAVNAKTVEVDFQYMPYELQRTKTFGVHPTSSNTGGAEGYLRVRSSYTDNNKYIGFIPSGYILRTGSGESWSSTAFVPASEDYYEPNWSTPLTTLSSSTADKHYYVGLKTSSGYVWSEAYSEDWSRLIFLQTKGSPTTGWRADGAKMQLHYWKNGGGGADAYVTMTDEDEDGVYEAWLPNASYDRVQFKRLNSDMSSTWNQTGDLELQSDKNMYIIEENFTQTGWGVYEQSGKFNIYANSNDKNWYLRFKPHYVLSYDKNNAGASGTMDEQSVAIDAVSKSVTVASNGFTAPTGYTFNGWNTLAGGGGDSYAAGDSYTLTANGTLYAQWSPIPVSSITVSPSSKTLDVGGTQQLSVEVLPATALDKAVTWSTSNGSIAAVSSTGLVTAKAPGSATITATAHDGSGVTGTCSITVNKIQPTKYDFSVDKTVLCGEETATLTLVDSEEGVTYELREDSSTPIAETQKTGTGSALTWTGLGAGNYVVYAVADATYTERQMNGSKITITAATATSITTQPTNQEVTVGEEATLTVVAAGTSLSYQWKESATEGGEYSNVASGGTSASYSVTPAAAGTKWYKCVVTGTCGTVTTDARKIVASAAVDPLVSWTMNVDNATWGAASTSNHGNTEISSIATSCDAGGEKASTSATAKVLMAEAEVTTSDPPSNSANFTFTLATGYKIVPEKITCKVFNVSSGSRTYKAQISDNNSHVYNSTNTLAVSTEATLTPATFNFASDLELKGNITLKMYAWDTDDSKNPTEFRMGPDIKFYGEIETACTSVAAPTGLTCSTAGVNSLAFSWTAASNASSYDVYLYSDEECTSPVTPTEGSPYNVSTNSATLTGLTASTTYYCQVQSKGDGTTYCAAGGTTDAEDAATTCTSITPTWSYPFSTIGVGITIFPTIGGNTGSGTVTYTSSATSYVEISNDMPKGKAAGSATVTASVAATGNYCSGSVTSGTITVVADQSGLIKQTLPTGKGTSWGTPSAPATSGTYASDITSTSVLTNTTGITIDTDSKGGNDSNGGQTAKITSLSSYDADKYMSLGFTVASGKKLNVSAIYIPIQPVNSNTNTFKAVLTDDDDDTEDIEGIITNVTNGKLTYIKFSSYGSVTGNVTLKIYAYGWTDGYRFGKSIVIDGETESTATLYDISTSATNGTIAVTVGGASASSAEKDATVTITATPSDGYEFTSWSVTKDAGGDVTVTSATTSPTTFTMPAEDVTVSATFSPLTYTITYNLNGASWAGAYDAPATYTVGTGATLPVAGNMTNTGYTFGGWFADDDLETGGVKTEVGTSEYGNKEFWAKWTENTYTVTYDKNGGSGSDMSSTVGHYVTLSNNAYTAPSGKTFVEWNTASDGTGTGYSAGEEVELTANLTLYAIWAKAVGTINWTVTKVDSKLYRGGGGYSIKAEINDASWDAAASDSSKLELSATEGVTLKNIAKSINASGKAQIVADFDITTGVNADATKITFTLSVPENNGYAPAEDDHDEDLDDCGGSGTTVFSLTSITDVGSSLTTSGANSGAYYDASSLCTLNSGSDAVYVCACSSSGSLSSKNLSYSSSYWSFGENKVYIALYSATGFAAGDVITVVEGGSKTKVPHFAKASAATLSDLKNTDYYASKSTYELSMTSVTSPSKDNSYTYQGTIPTGFVSSNWLIIFRDGSTFTIESLTVIRGGGGIEPTLTWDADLSGGVAAYTGDADFTHTVTQNKNSFGAITYSSSNTSVVTVNATTGKVHIVGGGSATITATIAESGCYDEATATYDITVTDNCDDEPGTISTEDLGCDGIRLTVTGHTGEGAGATYQWYKDGATIGGATSASYTATAAGEYYVVVTNTGDGHCAMASTNTVVVEAMETATATKIVDEWYIKNGRRTPDIALVQTENADNFTVKSGSTVIWDTQTSVVTGFAGCSFYLGTDGIIYLKGQKDDETEPSGLTAGDETLTFIAKSCGGDASGLNITIHKQAATAYKEVAFVVDGTKGGAWDAVTSGHADGTMLYEYLDSVGTAASARKFMLYERNIYKTTDEKTIRQHYSQFDAILITDDPSTQTVPSKGDDYTKKGYVNAFGSLIDIRPILTMEAYVSALANWRTKGINGNPSSPNPRQYAMKLDCKNHAIFTGINSSSSNVEVETIDGVEYWTVAMVDSTKSPYDKHAYNDSTSQYPALQGFEASDVSDLMLLGEISGGTLYAGVERQEEPAARLLLLGVNNKALPNALTPEGKKIIENALTYLIETDMEKVDDCSNYFTDKTGDHQWSTAANWSKEIVPNSPYVKARILKPCVLSGLTTQVARVDIATSGKSYNLDGGECSGSLTIEPTGALIVGGEVRSAVAPYFNTGDLMPTTEEDLVINTDKDHQAALVFNNDKGDTKATVNLYSLGRYKDDAYQFQYFAVPMTYLDINPAFAGSGIYTYVWKEATGWERRGYYTGLEAFEGLGITTKFAAQSFELKGALTSTKEKTITLTAETNGQNIVGNSWLAPIDIASLQSALDGDGNIVQKTIYIYCTGNDKADGDDDVDNSSTEEAGQWLAIPINAAGWDAWTRLKVIPAMQGFCIIANSETTLTLNYNDHVRSTASDKLSEPLRAPKREASHEGIDLIRIRVADSQTHTDLYLFEGESFNEEFDNGWEAKYMSGDGRSAKLYAETAIGPMAVVAQPEYEGTVLGFAPGKETEYTFTFSGPNKEYYLNDLKEKKSTLISEDESYMFTFEEGDTNRFYISKTPINAPSVATGTENTGDGVKARKVLVNDKLYIILNGRVYSAEGVMVK